MENEHKHKFACVILAAGKGERMRSDLPKVMHRLAGAPLIAHVLAASAPLTPEKTVVVIAPHMDNVRKAALRGMPVANSPFRISSWAPAMPCAARKASFPDTPVRYWCFMAIRR